MLAIRDYGLSFGFLEEVKNLIGPGTSTQKGGGGVTFKTAFFVSGGAQQVEKGWTKTLDNPKNSKNRKTIKPENR